ncbi:MAG TPA: hypothetical protein VKE92_01575 [Anaerolineales bacterium]|nr:hypothetical protein [Anaerolineales bacterium]
MNNKNLLVRTVLTFVVLAIAGVSMAVSAKFLMDGIEQSILIAIGSAIFGASLVFFLVRFFALVEK